MPVQDRQYDAIERVLHATPATMADAVAILFAANADLHDAVNVRENRVSHGDAYLAMGRVTGFLAKHAGIEVDRFACEPLRLNSLDGPTPTLAAEWWFDRAMNAGITVMLKAGAVSLYCPERLDGGDGGDRYVVMADVSKVDREPLRAVLMHAIGMSPYGQGGVMAVDTGLWIFNQISTNFGPEVRVHRAGGWTVQCEHDAPADSIATLAHRYVGAVNADRQRRDAMTEQERQQDSSAAVRALFTKEDTPEDLLVQKLAGERASTPSDLRAKARALWWMYGGDDVVPAFDLLIRRQDALLDSLLRDLMSLRCEGDAA